MNMILVLYILRRLVSTWVIYHVRASQAGWTCLRGGLVLSNYLDNVAVEVLEEKTEEG